MTKARAAKKLPVRLLAVAAAVLALGLLFAAVDLRPDLSHLDASLLAGPEEGNYHAFASQLARQADERHGQLRVVATAGSRDNLERLAAGADSCEVKLGLVQDGVVPTAGELQLVARLPKSESVFFLGKDASQITRFAQLRGLRLGIGPDKGGTDSLLRQIFADPDLAALDVELQNHPMAEQVELLERGALDLGAFVVDEDADIVRRAVRDRGLELADFANLDVVARRYPHLWHGRIGAGQFDPVRLLPPSDRRVLRVDTLVVTNGCASHAETIAMLSLLSEAIPGLIEHNNQRGRSNLYPLASTARAFFEHGGPELADEHVPWLVNIMPPSNWVYVVMSISVLFNLMGFGHRFRLWRIDAGRVRLDAAIRELLGERLTSEEIHDMSPATEHRERAVLEQLDGHHDELSTLRDRCRKQSLSMLVPMGQEMAYRYQEDQIEEAIVALRLFRERLRAALGQDTNSAAVPSSALPIPVAAGESSGQEA